MYCIPCHFLLVYLYPFSFWFPISSFALWLSQWNMSISFRINVMVKNCSFACFIPFMMSFASCFLTKITFFLIF